MFERELLAAQKWADEAVPLAMRHFGISVDTELKADGTPVTVADRAIEALIRERIAAEFPGDAIVGEEAGATGTGARRWIIDPIDGTKNYARGIPVFATLIALEQDGDLVLGMVSAPAFRTRWWATAGGGAFRDGAPLRVSQVSSLAAADLCTGGTDWAAEREQESALRALERAVRRVRGFGDFWGHMLVAQGSMDVMVEFAPLAEWDIAAPRAIVEEAGGRWTSLDGDETTRNGPVAVTNGLLHDEVLAVLRAR